MFTGDLRSGRPVPLLIREPIWREWNINSVDSATLAELRTEYGALVGYEFEWGQITEEVFDPGSDAQDEDDVAGLALRWNFVLRDLHNTFLDAGGNLNELSDLAVAVLDTVSDSRQELRDDARQDALPDFIVFDEGNAISAFAVCVVGRCNLPAAREWMANDFIPAVLPLLVERLRAENASAAEPEPAPSVAQ